MSVQEICRVAENTQLGDGLFLMVLHAPKITELAQCGQFVHIACGEGHLLRRPISICAWKAPELRIVFQVKGEGTKWLSERRTGDELDVLGPLGHGFDVGALGSAPVFIGGGIGMAGNAAADAFKMICLGANGVFVGKILIQLLGCIGNENGRCNRCNTGKCPTGICTQDARLMKRLDVDKGAQNVVDYVLAFDSEIRKLLAPIGNSSLPVGRSDALVTTDRAVADKLGIQYAC